MAVIQVAKAPKKKKKSVALEVIAEFCLFYPQYTFAHARKLPYKRVALMLRVAYKRKALEMYQLTQIAFAPHTKKASGVDTLLKHFKEQMNGR